MALTKQFSKSKPVCKVTFELPVDFVGEAKEVAVVGAFNNWDTTANLLKKQKNGFFKASLELPVGQAFEFRYLVDQATWLNDDAADKFVPSGVSADVNGVIEL